MKVGFIGCGNMGGALARAVSRCADTRIYLCDVSDLRAARLADETGGTVASKEYIVKECDYVYIGVKPNGVTSLLGELCDGLKSNTGVTVVCMAAGVTISSIDEVLGGGVSVIRIMPNTPVGFGEGMTLAAANAATTDGKWRGFLKIMEHSGRVDRLDEKFIDAASAVSGSGPAFVYMFIEALADGGVAAGLPRDKALAYAEQTLIGAAVVARESGKHPEQLKDEVCSPGGSTIEGVRTLESGSFRGTVSAAVVATYEKARTLGKK